MYNPFVTINILFYRIGSIYHSIFFLHIYNLNKKDHNFLLLQIDNVCMNLLMFEELILFYFIYFYFMIILLQLFGNLNLLLHDDGHGRGHVRNMNVYILHYISNNFIRI